MISLAALARKDIVALEPYSSARSTAGAEGVLLDANENPFPQRAGGVALNRYPDPFARELRRRLAEYSSVGAGNVIVGNGSDELIDVALKVFCVNGDNIVAPVPTYPMYSVAAAILGVGFKPVMLHPDFSVDVDSVLSAVDARSKMIFLCSPNNPVGSVVPEAVVRRIAAESRLPVLVDEAYFEFCGKTSVKLVEELGSVIVLRTLSKAWGLAGLRLGYAIASPEAIGLFDKVKAPYNVSAATQSLALKALAGEARLRRNVARIIAGRKRVSSRLSKLGFTIIPSEANFVTARLPDGANAAEFCRKLAARGVVVRDRSRLPLLENCVRFTVGAPSENKLLLSLARELLQ